MRLFFRNIYIGCTVLVLAIPISYFGSIQRVNSPDFESYMYETTKHIVGSGAVFGYILAVPSVQLITTIMMVTFQLFVFWLLRTFFINITSVKLAKILYATCTIVILFFIMLVGIEIIDYLRWGYNLLALYSSMMIWFGIFVIVHLKLLKET